MLVDSQGEADTSSDVRWWSKELGRQTFDRTLTSVRRQLSAPEKQLSKFIHKPVIEKTSDFVGKTIARPSGILLGGIFSFIGSLGFILLPDTSAEKSATAFCSNLYWWLFAWLNSRVGLAPLRTKKLLSF